ncbi:MAG: FtsX-like permease family protein [Desulfobacteraceae bacterium]
MQRHRKILEYALSSLLRRKYKNIALIAVFSFIVAVLSSVLFLTHALQTEAENILVEAPELIVQKVAGGRHDLIPVAYTKRIKMIPGIGKVTPRYWGYYYDSLTGGNYTILGVDREIEGLTLLEGDMPIETGECAIGKGVAAARRISVGEELVLTDGKGAFSMFTVTGVFSAASELLTNDLVVLFYEDIVRLFDMPADKATDIVVEVFNDTETPVVARTIQRLLPDTRPIMKSEIIRTYSTVFNWRSGLVLTMFFGALVAFCILAWDKATGLSAEERQEIGILKAIGWETANILELKFWEGVIVSLTSYLTGVILAYLHIFYLGGSFLSPALKGWSVIFPSFRLTPYVSVQQIFILLFLTVLPYVASTIIPSWKAAITDPDAAMRG